MLVLTPDIYSKVGFADELHASGQDVGYCKLVVDGNKSVKMPTRVALFNIIYWEPLLKFGIIPSIKETFNIKSISNDSSSKVYSVLYEKFLDERPDVPYMEMVHAIFDNISRMHNFITMNFGGYLPSIDALSLSELLEIPEVKEICAKVYSSTFGTSVAEAQFKADSKALIKILKSLTINSIYHYIQTGVLKSNQIPQMLIAYLTRSDIDDTMQKNVISSSSFGGIRSEADFATETLSAKKSIFFSRDVIRKSQYSGRKMRLMCSTIEHIHPGSCGSEHITIPFIIKPEYAHNFKHKVIIDNGKRVYLEDDKIIQHYVGKPIQMVTQFGCRHTDGLCEHCAGYGRDRMIKYFPPGIHIGLLSSSKTSSIVSQKVLSAKHLISTNSKVYTLPELTQQYFYRDSNSIFWKPDWVKNLKRFQVKIPMDALGPIIDLNLDVFPVADSFSKVAYFELYKGDELVDTVQLEYDNFVPYLSEAFLDHMKSNYEKLIIDDDSITVPLAGFDAKQDMFKFIIMNDDMITYTESVNTFLTATISHYTDIPHALNDFAETVWRKSDVNIFFLETILHNMIIDSEQTYQLCPVTDPHHVTFGKMESIISNRTVSMKLAFERLKDYLNSPQTSNIARPVGLFGPFFGIV